MKKKNGMLIKENGRLFFLVFLTFLVFLVSMSGAVYQGLFKNPVVSPDLLGASNGASFGAALAILVGMSSAGIQTSAFLGGICAVGLVAVMNRIVSKRSNTVVNLRMYLKPGDRLC